MHKSADFDGSTLFKFKSSCKALQPLVDDDTACMDSLVSIHSEEHLGISMILSGCMHGSR